ncbi:hypothetical protein ABT186_10980 [Streptomyces sp. NPDC001634]|uniref:hypothetical protein n=1 Tax=Streptomyces sp. NPDC001634 TaxID=3154390 RepID=UPI0033229B72
MTTERVTVRVLLLFGDQAEIVADVPPEERGEPDRYATAEITQVVGVPVSNLPGTRLTAEVGNDGRLSGWQLAPIVNCLAVQYHPSGRNFPRFDVNSNTGGTIAGDWTTPLSSLGLG